MSPTPRYSVAITEPAPRKPRGTSVTPLHAPAVAPSAEPPRATPAAAARRHRWTVLLLPPARAAGAVRMLPLGARHLAAPVAALLLLLALASFGGARYGEWTHASRTAPLLARAGERAEDAELRARLLDDSLGALRTELARALAAAAAAPAKRTSAAAPTAPARVARPAAPLVKTRLALPLDGRITSRFSPSRLHPILRIRRPHRGMDIAAATGTLITAPAAGRVTRVGREIGYGLVVHLDHGDGVTTRFAHCQSALVETGQRVAAGTPIATVGATGLATRPHLHYEVYVRGKAVDPLRVSRR